MKKLHETMLGALRPESENKVAKEIELMTQMHKKEIEALKVQHNDFIKFLERQIKELKDQLDSKENLIKEIEQKSAKKQEDYEKMLKTLEDSHSQAVERLKKERFEELKKSSPEPGIKFELKNEETTDILHENNNNNNNSDKSAKSSILSIFFILTK